MIFSLLKNWCCSDDEVNGWCRKCLGWGGESSMCNCLQCSSKFKHKHNLGNNNNIIEFGMHLNRNWKWWSKLKELWKKRRFLKYVWIRDRCKRWSYMKNGFVNEFKINGCWRNITSSVITITLSPPSLNKITIKWTIGVIFYNCRTSWNIIETSGDIKGTLQNIMGTFWNMM